ncbi:MAG: hypothetical protein ABF274_05065 [Nonlabens sp.]|uniref:hypothetical protein n=1 Tax=Nonlabens sp. TaxID=1888209 RepID=UPI00321ADCCF
MHPRYKMLGVHTIIFLGVFLLIRYVMMQFMSEPTNTWITIIPAVCAWILSPRPHVVQMQSGKQYGLKFLFAKKIYKM